MAGIPKNLYSYLQRAGRILRSPALLRSLLSQAGSKLATEGSASDALQSVRADIHTSLALMRSWISGDYRGVSHQSLLLVVAGLAYLVAPVDALPDVLPGVGLIDDLTVLTFVFGQIGKELKLFREWHNTAKNIELSQTSALH